MIAEFKKEQAELGEAVETAKYESSDDDEAYYEKEVGSKPEKDLFSGNSGKGKSFDGGKRFNKKKPDGGGKHFRGRDKSGGREEKGEKKFGGRGKDRGDKKKRERKVFNSDGVGPDYKKGNLGKGKLRGVKGGKVVKNKGRKGKR